MYSVAYTLLFKLRCRSVHPSVTLLNFLPKNYVNLINVSAHPYATDAVVYTAWLCFDTVLGSEPKEEIKIATNTLTSC